MKVQIYGKNITVTPAIAEKIEKKLNHLEKYSIIDENVVANVVVRVYPNKQKIEVTIPTKFAVLRAEVVQGTCERHPSHPAFAGSGTSAGCPAG